MGNLHDKLMSHALSTMPYLVCNVCVWWMYCSKSCAVYVDKMLVGGLIGTLSFNNISCNYTCSI